MSSLDRDQSEYDGGAAVDRPAAEATGRIGTPTRPGTTAEPLKGMAVLIVEDEAIINLDLAMTAEAFGARMIVSAHSLEEARGALEMGQFDIAVLDLSLPDGDSMPLAEELHGNGVRIYFYSGDEERTDILDRFPDAGFVMKPATEVAWSDVFASLVGVDG